ncbi:MAG: glycerol-3-phosphate 1-O-acyltransferase PlsY [Bacteroidetes bacterium]|nr:glycerol-3-phosphate 1-O-acyltransferase PlsY [Bacteroidota bacterium]
MIPVSIVALAILAYLLGSIPSAVWVGQAFYGIDVREHGSGNAGATNTFRVLGKKAGIGVLAMDVIKGFTAACLVNYLPDISPVTNKTLYVNIQLLFGLSSVVGHLFPVFAGFKGGKGIATLFGMLIAIHYLSALLCLGIFVGVLMSTRYVSLSSIFAAVMFPILLIWIFKKHEPLFISFGICAALMVILTHRKNINRLLTGNENKARLLPRHYRNA